MEYAVSELSFDRYKFAREQALRALELLDQLIDEWMIYLFSKIDHYFICKIIRYIYLVFMKKLWKII